jgi:hypothetical protein
LLQLPADGTPTAAIPPYSGRWIVLRIHDKLTDGVRIQFWDGLHFLSRTLKEVGLRIQLGHWVGDGRCDALRPAPDDAFVVVHDDGVEEVGLDYCGCGGTSMTVQLLRAGLYLATTTNPRSAATFSVLRAFHLMSFESKCSAYEFYHHLARSSDNTGLKPPPVSSPFLIL